MTILKQEPVKLLILCRSLLAGRTFEPLPQIVALHPNTPVVVLTPISNVSECVELIYHGATNCIGRPINDFSLLGLTVNSALRRGGETSMRQAQ
jgi:DNA-binding NtrC family response regulator